MNEAEKILEQLGILATRMTTIEENGTRSAEQIEKTQGILAEVEKLQTQLDDMNTRFTPNLLNTGDDVIDVDELIKLNMRSMDIYLRGHDLADDEKRALASLKDTDGGFLLAETFETGVLMNAFNPAEIETVVPVLPTGGNRAIIASMQKPKVAWGPKNITLSDQDLGSGIVGIDIHSLRALVVIPNDTLEDAQADIVGELNAAFGRALEEARDDAYTIGTGVNMPKGFMKEAKVLANKTVTEDSGALDVDAMIKAIYKLKKTYRRNATVACNSATEGVMATFKDSQGQPLWRLNAVNNAPNTFMGLGIINPESMDDIAANKYPVCIADFAAGYRIRQRGSLTIQRLDEAFATADQTAFLVKQRIGGQTALVEAFQVVQIKS